MDFPAEQDVIICSLRALWTLSWLVQATLRKLIYGITDLLSSEVAYLAACVEKEQVDKLLLVGLY